MLTRNNTNTTVAASDDVVVASVDVVLASVLLAFLIVGTIFGNSLVCVALYLIRDLRTVTNYFVVSLAVADLLVGFVSMPLWFTTVALQWPSSTSEIYILWICLDIGTATASIMNLAVISLDRYYAITSPFHYPLNITSNRAWVCIVLVWMYALVVSVIRATPLFGKWYSYFVATASFFIPLPVMIFCYARIFSVARVQAAKIRKLDRLNARVLEQSGLEAEKNGHTTDESSSFINNNPRQSSYAATSVSQEIEHSQSVPRKSRVRSHAPYSRPRRALSSDIRAAKTLAIVMGTFILCWAPYIITLLVDVSCSDCIPQSRLLVLAQAVKWLHYSNSTLNPVIYTLLNRTFRNAFKRVLCRSRMNRRAQTQIISHSTERSRYDSYRKVDMANITTGEAVECTEKISVV